MLTQERLKEHLDYRDGKLFRKNGKRAGGYTSKGYRSINVLGKKYLEHRLIFFMFNGYLPEQVDHINRVKDDNRIENLRAADNSLNQLNTGLRKTNTSGTRGISWISRDESWRVSLRVGGVQKSFGHYKDLELAELVLSEVMSKYRPMWRMPDVSDN